MGTEDILKCNDPNEINEFCINSIMNAAEKSIPISINNNHSNLKLPKYVLDLI
jgi:hypothetical protein